MNKLAHILSNGYLGNRAAQTGNVQQSQPQQLSQGVGSSLSWSSENTNKNMRFFRRSILRIFEIVTAAISRFIMSTKVEVNIYV